MFVDVIVETLSRPSPMSMPAALAAIAARRAALDDLERRVIDASRDVGLSWSDIAAALGLHSRQAAEQRRLRLGEADDIKAARSRRRRIRSDDAHAGAAVTRLRHAAAQLADAIDVHAPRTHESASRLAQQTLRAAADGPPGALVDLVRHALADLDRIPRTTPSGLGPAIRAARTALNAAQTGT
jgi:hypothetical protein